MGRGSIGATMKDTGTESRGRVGWGREVGLAGVVGSGGWKMQTTVIEQQ